MLVLSRKKSETVVFYDKANMGLLMVAGVVEEPSGRCRIGFNAHQSIGIIRTELTTFCDMPFGALMNLPFGTKVEILQSEQVS